ncbi:hypothetical protein Y032_0025g1103 [Ancylostoma ceylanicum]|uniref:Uncharacterized protein n=1 Tax=Ancylostoma ceylanicum TaxID=53326 RepID=A0A016UWZ9_9BILA|nr:hypothetical protein Y032_0025g1103 [Ancylostoma ceylanicum]
MSVQLLRPLIELQMPSSCSPNPSCQVLPNAASLVDYSNVTSFESTIRFILQEIVRRLQIARLTAKQEALVFSASIRPGARIAIETADCEKSLKNSQQQSLYEWMISDKVQPHDLFEQCPLHARSLTISHRFVL